MDFHDRLKQGNINECESHKSNYQIIHNSIFMNHTFLLNIHSWMNIISFRAPDWLLSFLHVLCIFSFIKRDMVMIFEALSLNDTTKIWLSMKYFDFFQTLNRLVTCVRLNFIIMVKSIKQLNNVAKMITWVIKSKK